eukprot:Skav231772  [mRNA]  locus=scaffold3283:70196:70912:+ [translate_table: standard]
MSLPWPQIRVAAAALGVLAVYLCWRCRDDPKDVTAPPEDGQGLPGGRWWMNGPSLSVSDSPAASSPAASPVTDAGAAPERTAVVARRMIFAHLGLKLSPEQRQEERAFWQRRTARAEPSRGVEDRGR